MFGPNLAKADTFGDALEEGDPCRAYELFQRAAAEGFEDPELMERAESECEEEQSREEEEQDEEESYCGDGVVDWGAEFCDDGNTRDGDGCSSRCEVESYCGNWIVDLGEECDDGNSHSGDGCSALCRREHYCGDGLKGAGEECDDGYTRNFDGCSSLCRLEVQCGNGRIDPGEDCDDGNTRSGDWCDSGCRVEWSPVSEDDGNGAVVAGWSLFLGGAALMGIGIAFVEEADPEDFTDPVTAFGGAAVVIGLGLLIAGAF